MDSIASIFQRLPKQWRGVLQLCVYGLAGGAAAVLFQWSMSWIYRHGLLALSHHSFEYFAVGSFILIVVSSLIVGWLLSAYCPEAAGSGIPQVKLAFWKDFGLVPVRVAWVKFLAGIIGVGGGASLGREGPSVQLAATVASELGGVMGEAKQNRRPASAAGAAAGLAAAFNTPIAATTFVLEEIIGDLNSRLLGGVLLASVLGALVVHGAIGPQPAFSVVGADSPSWVGYVMAPLVAALAAVVGVGFQVAALGLRFRMKATKRIPGWLIPVAGGLITWALGLAVFGYTGHLGVFSLGYDDLTSALNGDLAWKIALLLLVTKFVATSACYGFGGCGGIFSPTLFFGGMIGAVVGAGLFALGGNVSHADILALVVVGMSASLGAVVGAPVTGILIVFEMTHQFSLVPVLMLGALTSQAVSRLLRHETFYEAILTQDGHQIEHVRPPRDLHSWMQTPVTAIASFKPVLLDSLEPYAIVKVLKNNPYERYPVEQNGKLIGILTRKEAEAALASNRAPKLDPVTACLRSQTVGDLQGLLLASTTQFVVLLDRAEGQVIGVITLHDLLRAEIEKGKDGERITGL